MLRFEGTFLVVTCALLSLLVIEEILSFRAPRPFSTKGALPITGVPEELRPRWALLRPHQQASVATALKSGVLRAFNHADRLGAGPEEEAPYSALREARLSAQRLDEWRTYSGTLSPSLQTPMKDLWNSLK